MSVSETFAAALRERTSPCDLRSSGAKAIPSASALRTVRGHGRCRPETKRRPSASASAPASARRSSVRPEPTSPPRPRISPRRSVNEMSSSTPGTLSPSTRSTSSSAIVRRCGGGLTRTCPSMAVTRRSFVQRSTGSVATSSPSRITETRSHRREHLVEVVGDVDDRDSLLAQPANRLVEALALGGTERGRGLVHDQDAVVGGERPHDLEQPLVRHRERRGPHVRVDRESEPRGQLPERRDGIRARDERSATLRAPEEDVGGGRQLGHDLRLLVDRGDTGPPPGPRVAVPDLDSEHLDHPASAS